MASSSAACGEAAHPAGRPTEYEELRRGGVASAPGSAPPRATTPRGFAATHQLALLRKRIRDVLPTNGRAATALVAAWLASQDGDRDGVVSQVEAFRGLTDRVAGLDRTDIGLIAEYLANRGPGSGEHHGARGAAGAAVPAAAPEVSVLDLAAWVMQQPGGVPDGSIGLYPLATCNVNASSVRFVLPPEPAAAEAPAVAVAAPAPVAAAEAASARATAGPTLSALAAPPRPFGAIDFEEWQRSRRGSDAHTTASADAPAGATAATRGNARSSKPGAKPRGGGTTDRTAWATHNANFESFRTAWANRFGAAAHKEFAMDAAIGCDGPTWTAASPRPFKALRMAAGPPPPAPAPRSHGTQQP
jgi:hypothetical protein